jgi:hypothetical protein
MAKKTSTGKSGSGSQSDKSPGGKSGEGGESTESEENEEEEEEEESSEESESSEDKNGDSKGKEKGDGGSKDGLDLSTLPQETQDYIRKLRRENAKYRTKATNLENNYNALASKVKKLAGGKEDDELTPEQRAEQLEATAGQTAFDNAILSAAVEHGVGKSGLKYFRFLVQERVNELGEGEELGEDDLAEIAAEAAAKSGGKGAKTSVTGDDERSAGGGKKPGKSGKVTLDQFVKMTVSQKSDLQKQDPDLYVALFTEAREKRKFV